MQVLLLLAILALTATCACAEDAAVDGGKDAWLTPQALVVVPPEYPATLLGYAPVKRVEPRFPKVLERRGIKEGCTVARMHITEAGDVDRVDILKSDPTGVFDEAAKQALLEWKFPAGGIPGKPGPATGEVQILFYLPGRAHDSGGTIEQVGTYPGGPLNPPHPQ